MIAPACSVLSQLQACKATAMEELTCTEKKKSKFLGQISPESFPFKFATWILLPFFVPKLFGKE